MALTKQTVVDLIEVTENNIIQVRTATRIFEDDVLISSSFHRTTIAPGDDYNAQPDRVRVVCKAVFEAA